MIHVTPELLLEGYRCGIFPMAETRTSDEIFWVEPKKRGILPLEQFHVSRSLARAIMKMDYDVRINSDFAGCVRACADREDTWINDTIFDLYQNLHDMGHAHSIEVWRDNMMIGGVYGVTSGAAFFGESMFSRATNGSKIALAYAVDRLRKTGFTLFDTQFITPHLASLGGLEISQNKYLMLLYSAHEPNSADILDGSYCPDVSAIAQRNTHTSNRA